MKHIKKILLYTISLIMILILSYKENSVNALIRTIIYDTDTIKTQESQEKLANEIGLALINTQISIGLNIKINSLNNIITAVKELESLALLNIVDALELSKDREATIKKYISDSDRTLISSSILISNIGQEVSLLKIDLDSCLSQKDISDKKYFDSMRAYDEPGMKIALEDSIKYGLCASENRIKYNTQVERVNKAKYYYSFLENKYKYLDTNKDLIVDNFDLMKSNIMAELIRIKVALENNNY